MPNPVPELTETERLKLENFALRQFALETQLRQNTIDRVFFLRSIEEKHPGWRWQDPEGLVEKEDEPETEPEEQFTRQ
jgi:hypothetical protein